MAPWGPPKCHLPPSLRCGDSCRHFVCCSSCSCRRCCCCCHCGLWWAWSRSAGGVLGGKGTVLGFVKSFCALLKNWNAASRARKLFIFVDFWLRVLTNNKVAQLPFVFQFCTFLCASPTPTLPLLYGAQVSMSFGFPLPLWLPSQSQLTCPESRIFSVLVVRLLWQYFPLFHCSPFAIRDVFNNLISFVNLPDRFNLIETKLFNFDFRLFNGLHRYAALDFLSKGKRSNSAQWKGEGSQLSDGVSFDGEREGQWVLRHLTFCSGSA